MIVFLLEYVIRGVCIPWKNPNIRLLRIPEKSITCGHVVQLLYHIQCSYFYFFQGPNSVPGRAMKLVQGSIDRSIRLRPRRTCEQEHVSLSNAFLHNLPRAPSIRARMSDLICRPSLRCDWSIRNGAELNGSVYWRIVFSHEYVYNKHLPLHFIGTDVGSTYTSSG